MNSVPIVKAFKGLTSKMKSMEQADPGAPQPHLPKILLQFHKVFQKKKKKKRKIYIEGMHPFLREIPALIYVTRNVTKLRSN